MRNQWRQLLHLRCYSSQAQSNISPLHHFQVPSFRSISYSFLHQPSRSSNIPLYRSSSLRFLSSEPAIEPPKDPPVQKEVSILIDIFSKTQNVSLELESNNVILSHDLILGALRNLKSSPDVARGLFNWVLESENEKILSSKSYNLMLGILVENGFVNEFWDLVDKMKKKGYGLLKAASLKAIERFEKDGLVDDVKRLNELYVSGSIDNSVENICSRVCRVIRRDVWSDDVEKYLRGLNIEFSSELVSMVLENLGTDVNNGLMFFKSGLFEHDEQTFNAMVKVLSRGNSIESFWTAVEEMRKAGFEMEKDTYVMAMEQFVKKKMIHDAVDLWECAMSGVNKPSVRDCTFLLKKIVSGKELDMDLFSLVVKIFKEQGDNMLTDSMFESILKSLTSVGRLGECNKILKALEVEGGFTPSASTQNEIAFHLSRCGKFGEASEFMDIMEASDSCPDHVTWSSLVYGFCFSGDLEKASNSLQEMVEKVGVNNCQRALESVVNAYCRKNRAIDAFNLLSKMIQEKEVHPWHSTFEILISKLLTQRKGFKEALDLLPLMKTEGYPPFLLPFIEYLSKSGSPDDAMTFFEAMTVKKFPSTPVFVQLFEAYFSVGKIDFAQDLLLKCPRYVRNHADVLNLFSSVKSGKTAASDLETATPA